MALVLAMNSAHNISPNIDTIEFPPFDDSIADMADLSSPAAISPAKKLLEKAADSPTSRKPTPGPTHIGIPYRNGSGNGHRILRSATVGYTAPEFKGKQAQMEAGPLSSLKREVLD
jgi:glutamate dehydrogenase